jgi:hypothetical protein
VCCLVQWIARNQILSYGLIACIRIFSRLFSHALPHTIMLQGASIFFCYSRTLSYCVILCQWARLDRYTNWPYRSVFFSTQTKNQSALVLPSRVLPVPTTNTYILVECPCVATGHFKTFCFYLFHMYVLVYSTYDTLIQSLLLELSPFGLFHKTYRNIVLVPLPPILFAFLLPPVH